MIFTRQNIDSYVGKVFKSHYNQRLYIIKIIDEKYYWTRNNDFSSTVTFNWDYGMILTDEIEEKKYNHRNKEQFDLKANPIFL